VSAAAIATPAFDAAALVRQRWETAWDAASAARRLAWLRGLRLVDSRLPALQTRAWGDLSTGVASRIILSNHLPPAPGLPAIARPKRRQRG